MPEYRLSCFGQSGNAYKPALFFALGGIDWTPVWVDFFKGEHRTPEFKAKNEAAQVPILEHGDVCLSQSGLILNYLAEQEGKFGGETAEEAREVLRWLLWDNYSFTSTLAPLRFIGRFVPEEKRSADVLGFLQGRMAAALKVLDGRLAGRGFVATDGPSIADFSIAGYVYYGDELPFTFDDYPNVKAWMDRLAALPGWKGPYDLMPTKAG